MPSPYPPLGPTWRGYWIAVAVGIVGVMVWGML